MIGMPQETHKTLVETYEMIKKLPLDKFAIFFATPYPGTELFDYCVKHNLLSFKTEECVDIDNLQCKADRPHFKPHELTMEDLLKFQTKCRDYLKEKRMRCPFPLNYPLRYRA